MKAKFFLIGFLILLFVAGSLVYYFRISQAQLAATPTPAPAPTSSSESCSDACFKKVTEKLDSVLASQADIVERLEDLRRLVNTRKVD